nr:TPA_asm: FtsK [Orchesella springtail adintovirus]
METHFNWQLEAPACIMISGMTGSGKSQLTKRLLQRKDEIFDKPVHRVLWCYTETQPELERELRASIPNIEFHRGLPDDIENPTPQNHMLLVLDDLIHECKNNKVQSVFVRQSHHQNISCLYLTQNAFEPGQRTISLQCRYIILMRNPRDNAHYQYIGRAMNGGKNCPTLETAYKDCLAKPYSYVVLDYSQTQNDLFRIRNSLFPEEMTIYKKQT